MWPGFFVTAVTPVLSNQRAAVLRQGGHVLSRQFRYYVPDFSGRMVVQFPIIVRWVPILLFSSFCGFGFFVFFLLLAVVGYLMIGWFWACVLISAMSIYDDLAFQKVFFVAVYFCWTMWGSVLLLLFVYVVRDFSNVCALVFFWILLGLMAWVWMDGILLVLMTIFTFCLGCLLVWAGEIFLCCAPSSGEIWN